MEDNKKVKKPFYKKWWVWVIAVFALFIIWPTPKSSTEQTSTSKSATKQEENKIIKVGESTKIGNLGIKVMEAKEKEAISNESGKATASGKFVIIKLEIKNEGEEATEYSPHEFNLKEDKKTYEVDDNSFDAQGYLNSQEKIYNENKNFIGSYDKFNSGITKQTYIVYDVPKEVKLENLKLVAEHGKNIEFNLK